MGLTSHLKCCFKRILEKSLQTFSLRSLSFVCCRLNIYRSALIFRNRPCPEKFLVTRLAYKSLELDLATKNLFVTQACVKRRGANKTRVPFLKKGGEFFQFKASLFFWNKWLTILWKNGTLLIVKERFSFYSAKWSFFCIKRAVLYFFEIRGKLG